MVSRDFSLRPTTPILPTGRQPKPIPEGGTENPSVNIAPTPTETETLPLDNQALSRASLNATAEANNGISPQIAEDIATVEAHLEGTEVDSDSYTQFTTATTLPMNDTEKSALRTQMTNADALVNETAETLLALTTDEKHPQAGRRQERQHIPAARAALKTSLQTEREQLNTAKERLDPVQDAELIQDLDTKITRLTAAESLVDRSGQLDTARRELLDAKFGVNNQGRVTLNDQQLQTEMASRIETLETATTDYEEALAVLAGSRDGEGVLSTEQVNGFRELSTRTRQDVRQFKDFVYEPDKNTMDMMQQLGRGGRSLSSRYQNYSGFMRKRVEGNRSGRANSPTYETFNTRGYVNSLRHDLSDAKAFSQRFSNVLRTMEQRSGTSNPMSADELKSEVRKIYSTESGDPFVKNAVIKATTDVGEARRLTQVAQQQIDQASRLLDQADSKLNEASTAQDGAHFDEARLRVTEARDNIDAGKGVNTQAQNTLNQARTRNSGSLDVLPPSMQQDFGQVQSTTGGTINHLETRVADNNRRADDLNTRADTQDVSINAAEEQAIKDRERNGEQINYFMGALETMAPGSEANIQLELGIRLGTSAGNRLGASATGRAVVGLTAEKGAGLGGTYTVRANYGFEGELKAQFFGLSGSVEYSKMFSNGVSFYNADQAKTFAKLTTNLVQTMGDKGIRSAETTTAWNNLTHYVDQNAYRGDNNTVTTTGKFGDQEVQLQKNWGTHHYTTFDDVSGGRSNGTRDAGEAQIQETIGESGYSGSFSTKIKGQDVGISVSTTTATMQERRVNGVPERGNNQSSNVTKVRLTLPYSTLATADDRTLEQMLVSALSTVPGSDPQMHITADTFKGKLGEVRTQARSQKSSGASVVIEYARLRNPDGSVENALRVGRSQQRKGELALPTLNPAVQLVGGYDQSSTVLFNALTWKNDQ